MCVQSLLLGCSQSSVIFYLASDTSQSKTKVLRLQAKRLTSVTWLRILQITDTVFNNKGFILCFFRVIDKSFNKLNYIYSLIIFLRVSFFSMSAWELSFHSKSTFVIMSWDQSQNNINKTALRILNETEMILQDWFDTADLERLRDDLYSFFKTIL